ncbi:MAG: hypothetical protein NT055_01590 [Nitrospirae bacterium]|nr:hypothetical protein [Nitrospirota bacterium]
MEETKLLLELDLSLASREVIEILIEDTSEPSIFADIAKANTHRPEILRILIESPDTPDEVRHQILKDLNAPVKIPSEVAKVRKTPEMHKESVLQRIQRLSVTEKRHLARMGGREIRSVLIKDPNKEVLMTLLDNPKITETEIEIIAKSRFIPEEALRKIAKKREWMKKYPIVSAVVSNPKTPAGIAVTFLNELKTRDLALLEKNRNVSEAVRTTAKTILQSRRSH